MKVMCRHRVLRASWQAVGEAVPLRRPARAGGSTGGSNGLVAGASFGGDGVVATSSWQASAVSLRKYRGMSRGIGASGGEM